MPRKKKRAVRGTPRASAPSRYAWHRRVPWIAIGAAAIILVVGVLLARSFGVGESAGRFTGPGTGVGTFTPAGASPPVNFADLSDASPITANPATNWTAGQFIQLADGTRAHWNGTIWVAGVHP